MATPNNILQNVALFVKGELAWLQNSYFGISESNKRFNKFNEQYGANLGDNITFDLTPRYVTYDGLIITQQPSVQRVQTLTCSQAANSSAGYTDQQFIFNVEDYMREFGMSSVKEIGSKVEKDILKNFISGVTVNNPQASNFGEVQYQSGPFRFYGNGVTPITSYQQLAQAVANFEDFGFSGADMKAVLPVTAIPSIVGSGLNQFAQNRNNEIANSWELGGFAGCKWFTSNYLPEHISGTVGDATSPNNIITLVSTNDPTGANVTQITVTEPTGSTDANAFKAGDLVQVNDGVPGFRNYRFLTFIGHQTSAQPVQFRVIADAATVSGTATLSVQTINGVGLVWQQNANQNLNQALQAGMKATVAPSHRAGCLMSGNSLYTAMPTLPNESPFDTVSIKDEDSGASLRHYWGSQFGLNNRAYVRDCIWASTLIPENSMRLLFPL